jgi:hypothetical protein
MLGIFVRRLGFEEKKLVRSELGTDSLLWPRLLSNNWSKPSTPHPCGLVHTVEIFSTHSTYVCWHGRH